MRVADLHLKATWHHVRVGARSYRVLRPARALHGTLTDRQVCWSLFDGTLDRASMRALTLGWALAARSPGTIVHLPIASGAPRSDLPEGSTPGLDLVLMHQSLQVPASRWKTIRGRLGPGRAETLTLAAGAYADLPDPGLFDRRRDSDPIRHTVAADTLVLTGSRLAFARDLGQLRAVVEDGPAERATHPDWHQCVELAGGIVHLEYVGR